MARPPSEATRSTANAIAVELPPAGVVPVAVLARLASGVPVPALTEPSPDCEAAGVPVPPFTDPSGEPEEELEGDPELDAGRFTNVASALLQSPSSSTSASWLAGLAIA